jgi:WD40 repeat protein
VAEIHRHDLDTGEDHHVACPSLQPTTGAVHPEEDFLLVGGAGQQSATPAGRVLALRLPDLSTALEWTAHGGNGRLDALAISPDGRTLATGGGDLSIRVWRMAGVRPEEILTLNGHASPPTVAAFGPKGQTLVTGDSGGRIWVWRATTDLGP